MPSTGFEVFDETIQKTNTLLKTIEAEMGWSNHRNLSYAALRSVLHVLRDRITIQPAERSFRHVEAALSQPGVGDGRFCWRCLAISNKVPP